MLESPRKASSWLGFSNLNQGGVSHFLGLGGPPNVATRVALLMGMLPISSGEGCPLFGLGHCLGIGMGGTAVDSCSSAEKILGGRTWVEGMEVLVPIEGDTRQPELP